MRTKKTLINITAAVIGQVFAMVIGFISRVIFIRTLGIDYLGVNGLFTNILSMLALVELGIGPAIIFSLYRPLAFKEELKVKALMNFYAKAYWIIGMLVLLIGLVLLPFLDIFIKDPPDIPDLTLIYLLFLANSVITYFFAYKRSLIIADQKSYITTLYKYSFYFILNVIQIIILLLTKNFILFLLAQIVLNFLQNLMVSWKTNKMYPYIRGKNKERLDNETKTTVFKNVRALVYHKIGGTAIFGTTNIIISSFVGIVWVGLYSNYLLITNSLNSIIGQFFSAITASIGNLNAYGDREKSNFIFKTLFFISWWIFGFSSICLLVLINPFITLWIGREFTMDFIAVLMIVINFFVTGMRKASLTYKDSMGLFWNDRYKPLAETAVNLIVSLILVQFWGLIGVLAALFISTMAVSFWVEPYVLYKYGFEKSCKEYFQRYFLYTIITIILSFLTVFISNIFFYEVTIASFLGRLIVCLIVPNITIMLGFYKTKEFKYLLGVAMVLKERIKRQAEASRR
ncbi:lipopolysaccharide biosynthesis protein [Syntrophomonas erecta subsp. sporosyntropha]